MSEGKHQVIFAGLLAERLCDCRINTPFSSAAIDLASTKQDALTVLPRSPPPPPNGVEIYYSVFTEWRIHQHHVIPLLAEVHESKPPHGIFGEEPPLKPLAVLGFLGVLAKSFDHLGFGLLEELGVGDP